MIVGADAIDLSKEILVAHSTGKVEDGACNDLMWPPH